MKILLDETVTPGLQRLVRALNGAGRLQLWRGVAGAAEKTTRNHIRKLEGTRHATARALGAQPTGRMSQAISAVSSEASEKGCSVGIADPIFARAGRDVTITPKRGKALAIPLHALAYGRLPRELSKRGVKMFRLRKRQTLWQRVKSFFGAGSSGEGILAMADPDNEGRVIPLYALKRRVVQKQDRTLLPADAEYGRAAEEAAGDFLNSLQAG